jgi:TonB-dependent starch-binding outer membrane protein SusC
MKYKQHYLLLLLWALMPIGLLAQGTIAGTITEPSGEGAVGVSVTLVGTRLGVVTDFEGNFKITNVPAGTYTVKTTYTGFLEGTQEVTIRNGETTNIKMTLQENSNVLDEVVILGYDVQRKRDLVGSVSKVTSEKLNEIPGGSFENALQGKAAGVQVVQSSGIAGAGSVIRIRGVASLSAGGDPLMVVDGVPIFQDNFVTGERGGQNNNPLNSINPADIESIEILKDASATAIYGSRGANGVVLITTKRGKKGKPTFDFSSRIGTSQPTRVLRVMNADEWLQVQQEAWENDGNPGRVPLPNGLSYQDIQGINTDWINEVIGTGTKFDNSLSFTQGGKKLSTYANVSNSNAGSYLVGNTFKRLSGRVNLDYKPIKSLTISLNTSVARGLNERIAQAWAGGLGAAQSTALPIYPIYRGPQYPTNSPLYSENQEFYNIYQNPVAQRELTQNHIREIRTINNLQVAWQPTSNLTFTAKANYEFARIGDYVWEDAIWTASIPFSKSWYTYVNNRLGYFTGSYQVPLKNEDHNLRILGGTEYQRVDVTGRYQEFGNLNTLVYKASESDTMAADLRQNNPYDIDQYKFHSYFTKLTYSFKDKFLLSATVRRDGSSKFGANRRFGNFPSVGVGYIISEENFMKNQSVINFLKFKASWGLTGNADINWRSQFPRFTYDVNSSGQGYLGQPVRFQDKLENPNLQWETSTTYDGGVEMGLWQDRITVDLTFYRKLSKDVFIDISLPFDAGIPGNNYKDTRNIATIENKGVELGIKTQNVVRKNFYWSTTYNLSRNINEIIDVANATPDALDGGFGDTRVVVGETFQNNYIIKWMGVDPATGRPIYESILDDGTRGTTNIYDVTNNRQVLGNAVPDLIGSVDNQFRFGKHFDLNMLWVFTIGGEIYDDAAKRQLGVVTPDWNMRPEIFDRWQQPGDNAQYPRLTRDMRNWGGNANFWQNNHSLWLYDGTYARLRTLTLGYNASIKGKPMRVFLTGGNLITFTNFIGWDPEIARDRTSNQQRNLGGTNLTYLTPPQEKSFTLGLNLQF